MKEYPLRELHDVALVHQKHVGIVAWNPQGVLDCLEDVALAGALMRLCKCA